MIGRTLGHYRIVDRLGTGGMGVVWLAEDLQLRRQVALKMLREDLARAPEKLARFEREAKAVAALNHPNIVTIHAVEEIEGLRFLVMEYVEGKTLDELIPPGGFALPELLRVAVPVAEALAAAHARGILHRDLKPANIAVGPDGRVKVLDFGLAKLQAGDATAIYGRELQSTLTQEGSVVGTLQYMSPEQLQLKHLDHRSDLFSLGIVLFEMATGDLPFRGESAAQVISSVLRDEPRRLDDLDRRLPPEIAEIVGRCLEKDVARRPRSAAEVRDRLAELTRAFETGQLRAASSRLRQLVLRVRRLRPARLAAAGALLAAVIAIPWAIGALRARNAAGSAGTEPTALAVLPLVDFSGDPQYFVDGMTDGLIGSLSRLGGLRVISRQSSMHYKGSSKRLPEIAEELGVDYLVEGSLTRAGDSIRLQARIVRPRPETQVWSELFERPERGVLALQNEVAAAIARAVAVEVSPGERERLADAAVIEPAVYEAFLQGRFFLEQASPETLDKAKRSFEKALELEPGFALAHAGLAEVYGLQAYLFDDPFAYAARQQAAAQRALELDPNLGTAHAQLGDVLRYFRWEWSAAEAEYRRGVELTPNDSRARRRYWALLASRGRFGEARAQLEVARRVDPLSAGIRTDAGYQASMEGDAELARREFQRALELDPAYPYAHAGLWWNLCRPEVDDASCRAHLEQWLTGMGHGAIVAEVARAAPGAAPRERLRRLAEALEARAATERVPVGTACALWVAAGELDRAEAGLLRAYEERDPELVWVAQDPSWRELRERPAIAAIIREMGLAPAGSG